MISIVYFQNVYARPEGGQLNAALAKRSLFALRFKAELRQPELMQLARVVGTVVATQKHPKFEGAKLLLVQPTTVDDQPRGVPLLAVDSVGAGVHEKVLIVIEGRAANEALGRKGAPVDAAIIGIVDQVDVSE